jgi:predicted MPP superfamily phosphohydrolase
MPTRRQFLAAAAAGAVAAPAATLLYTFRIEPHWLQFTRPILPIVGLPRELHGATLAQLSDLHVGPQVSDDYLVRCFRRLTELEPDIVAFTGDWISYNGPDQLRQLARVLRHVPQGRLATVGILGNHDYGFSWRMLDVADHVAAIAADAGVVVLRNSTIAVRGLRIAGLDDLWSPMFGPEEVLNGSTPDKPGLVLCHNPDAADRRVWSDYRGWILAGHTHGGQCKPPFLPPPLLPVRNRRYTSGPFDLSDGRHMYISRGVGHLAQVRFNVRPEIPLFRLERA